MFVPSRQEFPHQYFLRYFINSEWSLSYLQLIFHARASIFDPWLSHLQVNTPEMTQRRMSSVPAWEAQRSSLWSPWRCQASYSFLLVTMATSRMNLTRRQVVKVVVPPGTGLKQGAVKGTSYKGGNLTTRKGTELK